MLSPVGPLPPEVYWRRRAVAVAGLVVVVVLLLWLGSAVAGGSPAPETPAAAPAPATTTAAPASSTPPTPAPTTGTSTTVPAPGSATTTTPAATTPAPTTTAPPTSQAPLGPCPDADVVLTAAAAAPTYKVGEEPVFRLLVSTRGTVPCTRALDGALQQVLVYSADGTQRLWSSNDCYPGTGTETKTLVPGQQTSYSIRWSGTTSAPGCTAPRTPVPAGAYTVVVGLGGLTSAPAPFTLV
ncbi:hypothetical protein GCM10027047_32870 [Rhodococcus aerolatus]